MRAVLGEPVKLQLNIGPLPWESPAQRRERLSQERQAEAERAIEQDGLIWDDHISDLKGWGSIATELYGISSIPHAILIDQDGTVVATHLRGTQLERELDQLL